MNLLQTIRRKPILIGIGAAVVLVIIAFFWIRSANRSAARAEVALLVESIRQAQIAQKSSFPADGYVSAGWSPRDPTALTPDPVPWQNDPEWAALGWSPTQNGYEWVHGTYKITSQISDFKVVGKCDIDGDGIPAVWEATLEQPATQRTDSSVY